MDIGKQQRVIRVEPLEIDDLLCATDLAGAGDAAHGRAADQPHETAAVMSEIGLAPVKSSGSSLEGSALN